MQGDLTLYPTPDGGVTLFNGRYGEHYSSRHGPQAQSETVFVRGTQTDTAPSAHVLEVGFGLGLNFRTTLQLRGERPLHYLAYEAYPVSAEMLRQVSAEVTHPLWLDVLDGWDAGAAAGRLQVRRGGVELTVIFADITAAALPPGWASAIYLDGFSPTKNPEVWTPEFVARLAASLQTGGCLATYSAAGAVRRALSAAGLRVEKRRGLSGKREFVVAHKPLAFSAQPSKVEP